MPDLAYLSARDALAMFRSGDLSPVELLDAVIERARATEPQINALTDTYVEAARAQAQTAADAYAAGTARPLEGIPIAVKDEDHVAGQRTPNGSLLFVDFVPEASSPVVDRVLGAGGIVHARSAAPEFSMTIITWSFLNGISRNPWNPAMTPGGSSGGSGAALAAGSATLATGSDIGGSIRVPASMNGVVGFKPPFGRVPETWPWNRDPYLATGSLARTVADTVLLQNVISGPLPGDLWALPRLELPSAYPGLSGMRIALSPDLGYFDVDAEIIAALDAVAGRLGDLGAVVEPIDLDWEPRLLDVAEEHLSFQMGAVLRRELPEDWEAKATPYVREFFERPQVTIEKWMDGWAYVDRVYRELEAKTFAAGYEALLCPTTTTTSLPADWGHPEGDHPATLMEQLAAVMTYPFNTLGRLPVLDVPIGFAPSTGVPIGMQIVGPPEQDAVPFRLAAALEAAEGPLFERVQPEL